MNFFAAISTVILLFGFCVEHASCSDVLNGILGTVRGLFGGPGQALPSKRRTGTLVEHFNNVTVVDHMVENLPKVRYGHRVVDLFNGQHFDDILIDTPDEIRPAGVVAFYDSSNEECMRAYNQLDFDRIAETRLPARSRLFVARYDTYSAPKRAWYEFTPEMDLEKRFNVKSCPEVVFVSRKCNGQTIWCEKGKDPDDPALDLVGCEDFEEQCTNDLRSVWDGKGDLAKWIVGKVMEDGEPKISKFFGSYKVQGEWMQRREQTTSNTYFRNIYMSQAFPAFTPRGFKAMEIPKEFQDWLLDFVKRYERTRRVENWNGEATQMDFHEHPTTFIDMDRVRHEKEAMANKILKPLLEEWTGIKPLELTSFYGMREYQEGSRLREHIDRIDTHVLSVTLSVQKRDVPEDAKPWPLQVTDWYGRHVKYEHPGGTMVLYESSKLPHGRPYPNHSGIHLGCFCHFKPVNMHGTDTAKWESIAKAARDNVEKHRETARYRSTKDVEPEHPVYSDVEYGKGSIWKDSSQSSNGQIPVTFKNEADRPLQLFWYHKTQSEPVFQGSASPGTSFNILSFEGHTFFWAELESETPLPGGKLTIDAGKRLYTYSIPRDRNSRTKI